MKGVITIEIYLFYYFNDMNVEVMRVRTFAKWPENTPINASDMAKAGFFYTGRGTEVQCFVCGVQITDWNYGDEVMSRHRQAQSDCPFVREPSSTWNIPILEMSNNIRIPPSPSPSPSSSSCLPSSSPPPRPPSSTSSPASNSVTSNPEPLSRHSLILQSSNPRLEYGTFQQRLSSYNNWPTNAAVSPESLARAGFYYLQRDDMVECAFCRGIMGTWMPNDDPNSEHRITFPQCDFYVHQATQNSVLSSEKEDFTNVESFSGSPSDLEKLGIQQHSPPKQPKHATYESRLRTFQTWPENLRQTPEMLATAGFYYVGSGDSVKCFHCDGGLHNWEPDDDPWSEHARWFPKCGFVSIVRGQDFIKHCIDNRPALDPTIFFGVPESSERNITEIRPTVALSTHSNSNGRNHAKNRESESAQRNSISGITDMFRESFNINHTENTESQSVQTNSLLARTETPHELLNINHTEETESESEETYSEPAVAETLRNPIFKNLQRNYANFMPIKTIDMRYTSVDQLCERFRETSSTEESNGRDITAEMLYTSPTISQLQRNEIPLETPRELEESQESNVRNDEISHHPVMDINNDGDNDKKPPKHTTEDKRTENEPLSLEEEIRRLKEARLCKICMDREVGIVFLPCGHLSTCVHCAPSLTHCPMCRRKILGIVRAFLA